MRYRNLILIIVLIGLTVVFFLLRRGKPDEKLTQVFAADSTNVGGFELFNAADTIAVNRVGDIWMLARPVKWAANPDRMRYFFDTVLKASYSANPMSDDPKSHANYNLLDDKALHIKLFNTSGKQVAHCLFGNAGNPFDYFRYAGDNKVYRVQEKIVGYFEPDITGWRSPAVIAIPPEQLVKINVTNPKNSYTLTREGNLWYYADKLEQFQIPEYNPTMGKILNIVQRLDSYTVEDGTKPENTKYSTEAEVELTRTDGGVTRLKFIKIGENYYVILNGESKNLFLVPFDVLFRFTRHAATFNTRDWQGEPLTD